MLKPRFNLKTMLVTMVVFAIPCAYLSCAKYRTVNDTTVCDWIDKLGDESGVDISIAIEAESFLQRYLGLGEVEKLWIARNREGGVLSCEQLKSLTKLQSLRELSFDAPVQGCSSSSRVLSKLEFVELIDLEFDDVVQSLEALGNHTSHPFLVHLASCKVTPQQIMKIDQLPFVKSVTTSDY